MTRSILAALFYPEISLDEPAEQIEPDDLFQQQKSNSIGDRDLLYPRFTDRVDPSLYYTVFFPHRR
jgi:hypothetical protein